MKLLVGDEQKYLHKIRPETSFRLLSIIVEISGLLPKLTALRAWQKDKEKKYIHQMKPRLDGRSMIKGPSMMKYNEEEPKICEDRVSEE